MRARGAWWLGIIVGLIIGGIGIANGRPILIGAAILVMVLSVGRFLLLGR